MNFNAMPMRFERTLSVTERDIDQSGSLRLTRVVCWMEETEYAFLRQQGLSVSMSDERGRFGFPRLGMNVSILSHASLHELVTIELSLQLVTEKQLFYRFEVHSSKNSQALLATGDYRVACCRFPENGQLYPILIPDWVIQKLTT